MKNPFDQAAYTRREWLATFGALSATAMMSALPGHSYAGPAQATKIPIQIFSKHLQWLDYESLAVTVKEMGFDGIDLTVRPDGHVLPENVARDLPRAVEAIRKKDVLIDCITTAITAADEPYTESILSTASKLGIRRYRMGWISYDVTQPVLKNLNAIKKQLLKLIELNRKYNLRADYQNHTGNNFGSNPWELWYVINDLPTEYIASRFDVRHAVVEGYQSWTNDLRLLAPYIRTIDIKDFRWSATSEIQNVQLGKGIVDFPGYFKKLEQLGVAVPITVHCEYDLGGAQDGKRTFSKKPEEVIAAIHQDLVYLRGIVGN